MCGEKNWKASKAPKVIGSPPRVRGKALRIIDGASLSRITPACAGKRREERVNKCISEDHPRVCGEKHQNAKGKR